MTTVTCTKRYSNLPFAHRQHRHDGHCALIHGHNWAFEFEFIASALDENGFVIDFGKLQWLKRWLEERFDHTLVLNQDDPNLDYLQRVLGNPTPDILGVSMGQPCLLSSIVVVPNAGAEGLAQWVLGEVNRLLEQRFPVTEGRIIRVTRLTVFEDEKNSATAHFPRHP